MTVPFEPRRFRSTVAFYTSYRVPYPEALTGFVARHVGVGAGERVLDLGCGPGPLSLAFARQGCAVTAMDPEPDMLAAVNARAAEAGLAVSTVAGSSYDLGPALGRFRLVVMGRSFHWMDRTATLRTLDGLIEPAGAVVLFGDRRVRRPGEDWHDVVEALGEIHAPQRAAERRRRKESEQPHEVVLLDSAFSHLERYGVIVRQTLRADDILGRALSMSTTSPEALGNNRAAFEAALRRELARLSPADAFDEVVSVEALIARRPAEA